MYIWLSVVRSRSQIKICKQTDKKKKEHHQDLTYNVKYPMKICLEPCNGKTRRTLIEKVNEHSGKDINSHLSKHSLAANHPTMTLGNFTVLSSGSTS